MINIRDLNEILQSVASSLLKQGEEEMRLKLEHLGLINRRMQHEMYCKERDILKVKKENVLLKQNLETYTNAILAAKGD